METVVESLYNDYENDYIYLMETYLETNSFDDSTLFIESGLSILKSILKNIQKFIKDIFYKMSKLFNKSKLEKDVKELQKKSKTSSQYESDYDFEEFVKTDKTNQKILSSNIRGISSTNISHKIDEIKEINSSYEEIKSKKNKQKKIFLTSGAILAIFAYFKVSNSSSKKKQTLSNVTDGINSLSTDDPYIQKQYIDYTREYSHSIQTAHTVRFHIFSKFIGFVKRVVTKTINKFTSYMDAGEKLTNGILNNPDRKEAKRRNKQIKKDLDRIHKLKVDSYYYKMSRNMDGE